MLSIEECRKLIDGGDNMSDEEIKEIRDELYKLADICWDQWVIDKKLKKI